MANRINKHFLNGIFGILIVALIILLGITLFALRLSSVDDLPNLSDIDGQLVVHDRQAEKPASTIYRLKDGAPERLVGDSWKTVFLSPFETYVFGFFPKTPDQQYFFRATPRGGQVINISDLPGEITGISQSRTESHVMIVGMTNITTSSPQSIPYACILEKTALPESTECRFLRNDLIPKDAYNPRAAYQAWWHNENGSLLYVRELAPGESKLYTLNVQDGTLTDIEDTGQIPPTRPRLDERMTTSPGGYTLKRTSYLARVLSPERKRESLFVLSPSVNAYWLSDSYLLATKGTESWIINPFTKEKKAFITLPNDAAIDFYRGLVPENNNVKAPDRAQDRQ